MNAGKMFILMTDVQAPSFLILHIMKYMLIMIMFRLVSYKLAFIIQVCLHEISRENEVY